MQIKIAQNKDKTQLLSLEKKFQIERRNFIYPQFRMFDTLTRRKEIKEIINDKNSIILLAKEDKKVVGFLIAKIKKNNTGSEQITQGTIANLYVLKKYRKKGIATQLYNQSMMWFNRRGCKYIQLTVYNLNPAKKLYMKWGFKPFVIIMKKKLF